MDKRSSIAIAAAAALSAATGLAYGPDVPDWSYAEYEFERNYAAAQAAGVLPQGGSRMRASGGATARLGRYTGDFLACEASASVAGGRAGLGARGLWHWWGYEKFDPFFTFGAEGWFGGGALGPCAGWGVFWHFDDNWSLRFDTSAMLGVAGERSMTYSVAAGVQYSF